MKHIVSFRLSRQTIALVTILAVAFILRFYKLGVVPDGLQQDETSLGYNAYSILKTSRDEHGEFLPQNFKAFGEYKLPGYIYASVVPIALFGLTPFSIRLISAVTGFLSVLVVYFLTKTLVDLSQEKAVQLPKVLPLITTFLLAINPWHLHFSRAAFEVMLANFFILLSIFLFLQGVKRKKILLLVLSVVGLSASLYTYNIARIFSPVLGFILILIFRDYFKRLKKWEIGVLAVTTFVCLFPFFLSILTHGGADSTTGTLIFTSAKVQSQLQEFRSYFIGLPVIVSKVLFNYWTLSLWQYMNNLFAHLSVPFYFLNGGDQGNNSIGTTGQWYLFELPLVIWGICLLWQKRSTITARLLFAWILLLIAISSLTREPPQATRTFFLIFPITLCSAYGGIALYNAVKNISQISFRRIVTVGILSFASLYIAFYFFSYYVRFPVYYAAHWRTADRDVSRYISMHLNDYDKILFDENSGFMYSSLLFHMSFPPKEFQQQAIWSPDDSEGFTHPTSFGKFEIRKVDWGKDMKANRTLIISAAGKNPQAVSPFLVFRYPKRPVVISVGQNILRFPTEDPAYSLFTSQGK